MLQLFVLLLQKFSKSLKSFVNQRSKRPLIQGSKRSLTIGSKRFLAEESKTSLTEGSGRSLSQRSKKYKKVFYPRNLYTFANLFFDQKKPTLLPLQKLQLFNYKTFQEKLKFKINSNFITRQLKSLRSLLQPSVPRSIFVYPSMAGHILSGSCNLAAYYVCYRIFRVCLTIMKRYTPWS